MKKTVVVEYVGIEDVQEIMDDALACIREGHYVNVQIGENCGEPLVQVYVMIGGFSAGRGYDYACDFRLTDECDDVAAMNKCKNTLKNLLREEE